MADLGGACPGRRLSRLSRTQTLDGQTSGDRGGPRATAVGQPRAAVRLSGHPDQSESHRPVRQRLRDGGHGRYAGLADGPDDRPRDRVVADLRSEEHTSELQSLMRISYAVFCLTKKKTNKTEIMTENYTVSV